MILGYAGLGRSSLELAQVLNRSVSVLGTGRLVFRTSGRRRGRRSVGLRFSCGCPDLTAGPCYTNLEILLVLCNGKRERGRGCQTARSERAARSSKDRGWLAAC